MDKPDININKGLYLGLEVSEEIFKIHEIIIKGLNGILSEFEISDADAILKGIENSDELKNWKYPKAHKKWHITTLFKKGKSFLESHPAYKSFEKDKIIPVEIKGILYIPGKIITCIVFPETPVQNEFPHMTTLVNEYAPKHSNDVMSEVFGKGKVYEKEYTKVFKDNLNDDQFVKMIEITLFSKQETCYVYKFTDPIVLETKMKVFLN
jgi:hypothetical protein